MSYPHPSECISIIITNTTRVVLAETYEEQFPYYIVELYSQTTQIIRLLDGIRWL